MLYESMDVEKPLVVSDAVDNATEFATDGIFEDKISLENI
jgi:hypothetical protein